jgi:hypothetical protein
MQKSWHPFWRSHTHAQIASGNQQGDPNNCSNREWLDDHAAAVLHRFAVDTSDEWGCFLLKRWAGQSIKALGWRSGASIMDAAV